MQLKWIFHGIGINLLSSIYSSICSKNHYLWITIIPQFAKSILDILMFESDINLRSIFSNSSIRIFESFEIFRKTCTRIFQVLHFEVTRLPISKFFTISGVFSSIPIKQIFKRLPPNSFKTSFGLVRCSGKWFIQFLFNFFFLFFIQAQSPLSFFIQTTQISVPILERCFRKMGRFIPYFLSSHHDSIPIFLILILLSSPVILLYSSAVSFVAVAPMPHERALFIMVVNSVDCGDHQEHRVATSGFASNLIPFSLTKLPFILFAAIRSYSFYSTPWLWGVLRHWRILGSHASTIGKEREWKKKKRMCARETY